MAIPMFLAMTEAEWSENQHKYENIAWMACHFSPYSTGLSNCPGVLPPGAMLIVNDRTPICGHDPQRIAAQIADIVTKQDCAAVLLDFQRPDEDETAAVAKAILEQCPCTAAVTEYYGQDLSCPVFLPPVPPNVPIAEYLAPWTGREVCLEMSPSGVSITVTDKGSRIAPLSCFEVGQPVHADAQLHCHYDITVQPDQILFRLWRTRDDLDALLQAAQAHNVTHAVGLFQELGDVLLR